MFVKLGLLSCSLGFPDRRLVGSEKKKKEYIKSGNESGPSRPPTPHGPGLPDNFGEVVTGIYRSSFPLPDHFESIKKLNLKTIV